MARSKQERDRLWEEEQNEPYMNGLTWGEFKTLSRRQKSREWQKHTQRYTSYLGFWKTCNLSPCRRARACKGFLTETQYTGEPRWHDAFPPCVGPNGAHQPEVLACMRGAGGKQNDDEPKYDGRQGRDDDA